MALTPEEKRELELLELEKLEAEKAASEASMASSAPISPRMAAGPTASLMDSNPVLGSGALERMKAFMTTDTRPTPEVAAKDWAAAGPMERAGMLLNNFISYAKQPAVDIASGGANLALRAGLPMAGQDRKSVV